MAVIGRNAAVASLWRLQLTGLLGGMVWLTVHIYYLIGFRNRTVVLVNWAWNYLRKDRPIRMITRIEPDSPRRRADRAWDGEQTRSRARRRGPGQLAVRVAFRMP